MDERIRRPRERPRVDRDGGPAARGPVAAAAAASPPGEVAPGRAAEAGGERLDFLWKVHEVQHAAIRFADTKASAALVLASAVTGWMLNSAAVALPGLSAGARAIALAFTLATCLGFVATVVFAILSIRPRWSKPAGDQDAPPRG